MAISFNGDDGIKFSDNTVKGTNTIAFGGVGSYVFADLKGLPTIGTHINWGTVVEGNLLYATDRAGSRDPAPIATYETLWQCHGYSTNSDRGMLWRRVK